MQRLNLLRNTRPPRGVEVDLRMLAEIADAHAFEVWGEGVTRGEPIPLADASGEVGAYVFPYAFGVETFSTYGEMAERRPEPAARFGGVYVSARRTAYPVLRVDHALHRLYLRGEEAEGVGRALLDAPDARLNRIYWLGLHQEYFEIDGADRRVLLDAHTLAQVEPEVALRRAAPADEAGVEGGAVGAAALPPVDVFDARGLPIGLALKVIPDAECIPVVNWQYWCVPTAWTMTMCYYDSFVKGVGGRAGYGRLVGHWFEHSLSGNNVPDFIDQLIDPTSGPPPTWRAGFVDFADRIKKTYGYTFSTRDVKAGPANDWAWADIKAEIDAGRPFVWGTLVNGDGHATCAFGYRMAHDGSKRVIIYTTWGTTAQAQREEWLYTQGTGLTAITPGGETAGQNLVLWYPDGGDQILTNVATTICWRIWGDQIKTAEVSFSADGGVTWTTIRGAAPCNPGWNYCSWTPETATNRARVRIRGNDASGAYIAGDGSQSNVKVMPGPRPVTLKTILVKTQINDQGLFSAPHGLEDYTPDGYAIRAISVAVQHKNGNWHTLERSNDVDNRFWWNDAVVAGAIASPDFYHRPVQILIFAEHIAG